MNIILIVYTILLIYTLLIWLGINKIVEHKKDETHVVLIWGIYIAITFITTIVVSLIVLNMGQKTDEPVEVLEINSCEPDTTAVSENMHELPNTTDYRLSDWAALQLAIAMTESRFNPSITGKHDDRGIFQATPTYIREVNRLVGEQIYSHDDAYDIEKSVEMFNIIQGHYNKDKDINKAIHLHNKGKYYPAKVKKNLEFIHRMENVRNAVIKYESD